MRFRAMGNHQHFNAVIISHSRLLRGNVCILIFRLALSYLLLPCLLVFVFTSAHAKPWITPNDPFLRSDIQLLSDIGVIKSPVTTWPLNWSGIKRDLFDARGFQLNKKENEARQRVLRRCKYETREGSRKSYSFGGASGTDLFNPFGYQQQDGVQFAGNTDWLGKRFAINMRATTVIDSEDGDHLRFDGSYAAAVIGNWIFSAGTEQRWWGPGWEDSLLIGNSARPLPGVSLRRNHSMVPENKLISWLGPWHLDAFVARLESDRSVANPLMLGMRFNFKPLSKLEIAFSRTSLFGGEDNPADLKAFFSAIRGDDEIDGEHNASFSLTGLDFRYAFNSDIAFYGQLVDANGGIGSGKLGLVGVDLSLDYLYSGAKGYLEIADADIEGNGLNNYLSSKYQTGYYYKNRGIGYPVFGRSTTLGALLPLTDSGYATISLKAVEILTGNQSVLSASDSDIWVLSTGYSGQIAKGEIGIDLQIYSEKVNVFGNEGDRYSLSVNWKKGI